MNVFPKERLFYTLAVGTALMTACTSPGYNDNPSQQMTHERVGCPVATDFFAIYFSVHLQPPSENQDTSVTREIFRSYCHDLPTPGRVFLTADLVGTELRRTPIGLRVIQQEPGEDESNAANFKSARTLFEVPAKTYSSGVIESHFELNDRGYYAIDLIRGGQEAVAEEDKLTIPLHVGVDASANSSVTRIIAVIGAALGLALIGFIAFRVVRRRSAL